MLLFDSFTTKITFNWYLTKLWLKNVANELSKLFSASLKPFIIKMYLNVIVVYFLVTQGADGARKVCEQNYRAALKNYVYGRYVPRCQPNGNYEPIQCHSSICFCVNKFGVEINSTRTEGYISPTKCSKCECFRHNGLTIKCIPRNIVL